MASKLILLYATDTYKLSSLLLRRILLTKPTTLTAIGENTRQLLLDQSRPSTASSSSSSSASANDTNIAAIKILELDRELNLVQYYGAQEYATRWWASRSLSVSISNESTRGNDKSEGTNQKSGSDGFNKKKNVARVAFMITSEQRHRLSTNLGYTSQDIRSFKPIEALLLLEHGVKRETDDFRSKLKELLEENDRLMNNQQQGQKQKQSKQAEPETLANANSNGRNEYDGSNTNIVQPYVSPEEAQQAHAKPDEAMALLPVAKDVNDEDEVGHVTKKEERAESSTKSEDINSVAVIDSTKNSNEKIVPAAVEPPSSLATTSQLALVNVTPAESDDLHMKPDVAAAILTSHQQKEQQRHEQLLVDDQDDNDEVHGDELCWYEVVERVLTTPASNRTEDESLSTNPNGEQVIALFSTKKEAFECVRIKQSLRSNGRDANNMEGSQNERFLVRRRWNP